MRKGEMYYYKFYKNGFLSEYYRVEYLGKKDGMLRFKVNENFHHNVSVNVFPEHTWKTSEQETARFVYELV